MERNPTERDPVLLTLTQSVLIGAVAIVVVIVVEGMAVICSLLSWRHGLFWSAS